MPVVASEPPKTTADGSKPDDRSRLSVVPPGASFESAGFSPFLALATSEHDVQT